MGWSGGKCRPNPFVFPLWVEWADLERKRENELDMSQWGPFFFKVDHIKILKPETRTQGPYTSWPISCHPP